MYILFPFFATTTAEGLLRSTGIVIAVIVFPMGLGLLVASCVCLKEPTPEEEEPQVKKQPSKGIIINIFIITSFNKKIYTVEPLYSGHHRGTTLAIIEGWPHLRVFF